MNSEKLVTLQPVRPSRAHEDRLKAEILSVLRRSVFQALLKAAELPKSTIQNAHDPLTDAVTSGRIRYDGSGFSGEFSAAVSKRLRVLGAKWKGDRWILPKDRLPTEVLRAVEHAAQAETELRERLLAVVDGVSPEDVAADVRIEDVLQRTATDVDRQFEQSVRRLTIQPKLTSTEKRRVAEEYAANLRLSIKDWVTKDVLELRKSVEEHTFSGSRQESLKTLIQSRYGVAERKARFLARQETNLLSAKLRDARYEQAGIREYLWVSVTGTPQHPVRPIHKELNSRSKRGEVFRFDQPPVDDPDGSRHNPGENYNCRCVARPVVRLR